MANVYGTLFDNGGAVVNVKHTDFGAVGNGTTDDTAAIQAAIDSLAATGGVVYFPKGHYKTTSALTLHPVSGSYAGITFRGVGWFFGATPANNAGSMIEYASSTGSALVLGPTTATGSPIVNFTMYDMAVQATHASYSGNLVDLRSTGKCGFENCGFGGLPGATSATAASLIYGNGWVDTHFVRCQFQTAAVGVKKDVLGGSWADTVDNVSFERCVFGRCGTSADIQGSAVVAWFDRCTFEPAVSGAAAPVLLSGYPGGGVRGCWFGDSNGTGTWLKLGGIGPIVSGNLFSLAAVAVELLSATYGAEIEDNYIVDCATAVKAVSWGLKMRGNFIFLPNGTSTTSSVALDLSNDTAARVEFNQIQNSNASPAYTVGYKLASGTGGTLVDLVGSGPVTLVQNSATASWTTTIGAVTTYPSGATVKAANLVTTGTVELQGPLTMTGAAGSPASSTRFISDAGSSDIFYHNVPSGGSFIFAEGGATLARLMKAATSDQDTSLVLVRRSGSTWSEVRVSQGAADSGGTGYRVLRVPN